MNFQVLSLRLRNFRGVSELTVDFTTRTTVFVGINGAGKSTVLDALAIALSQLSWRICGQPRRARTIRREDIRNGAEFARIEVKARWHDQDMDWAIAVNRKQGVYADPERKSELTALNQHARAATEAWNDGLSKALPLTVYYDVNRAVLDVPMRVREKLAHGPDEAYLDALDPGGADFKRFFIWFRNLEDQENEFRRDDPLHRKPELEAVREAIASLTGFSELRVRRNPLRMTLCKAGQELNVQQLSDGERTLLALVGDMARRLSMLNRVPSKRQGPGVVLIDEIDLHLHPRWQRDVVAKLEGAFPQCQFILTTHSPQVLGELPPEAVKVLGDGQLRPAPGRTLGLSSSEVLEEIMEGPSRNTVVAQALRTLEHAMEDGDYPQAHRHLAALRSQVGDIPEVLRLEEQLAWLDPAMEGEA